MNNLIRVLSNDGEVMVAAIDSTDIVKEMERFHHTSAPVSAALGRLLAAGSLMGSLLKNDDESLTLRVDGGGPAGLMLVAADADGNVRGYATHPQAEAPLRADGKLNVAGVTGADGTLTVTRDFGVGEPYIGTVPLATGEIAEDITSYYASSEQTPTVCALGVLVNKDLTIETAGGFLLQLLPGASEKNISTIENNLISLKSVTEMLAAGDTPQDIIKKVLKGIEYKTTEERSTAYKCKCSVERTEDIIRMLAPEEMEEMKKESDTAEVICHFCNHTYTIDLDKIVPNNK